MIRNSAAWPPRAWPAFRIMGNDPSFGFEQHRPGTCGNGVISTLSYYKDGDGCGAAFGCCRVVSEVPCDLCFPLGYPDPTQYVVEMLR